MIKNVIFDLSEVIIWGYYDLDKSIEKETSITEKEFALRKAATLNFFFDAMRSKITEDEYVGILLQNTGWDLTPDNFKLLFRKSIGKVINGTVQIIAELKGKVNLILLSDHVMELATYIKQKHKAILDNFNHIIWSYEVGRLKSDKGSFQKTLDTLGLDAKETLFIDDSQTNVNVARETGMNCILFKNAGDLRKQLKNFVLL